MTIYDVFSLFNSRCVILISSVCPLCILFGLCAENTLVKFDEANNYK